MLGALPSTVCFRSGMTAFVELERSCLSGRLASSEATALEVYHGNEAFDLVRIGNADC